MIRLAKTEHIHLFKSTNAPALRIQSGDRLLIETNDALEGRGSTFDSTLKPRELVFQQVNPATGPIYVEGAEPGDALEIDIHSVVLGDVGCLTMKPGRVLHGEERASHYQEFLIRAGYVEFGIHRLPIEPMIGVIGTAPRVGTEFWSQETGDHGGNMDCKIIRAGSTLYLPVFVQGGLLAAGDVHAAMGDGEVFGQGIEVAAEIDLTVTLRPDCPIRRPMVRMADRFACIASNEDIEVAQDLAIRDMGEYLMHTYAFSADEAWLLIALFGDLEFCQVVNPQKTVRMVIQDRHVSSLRQSISQ